MDAFAKDEVERVGKSYNFDLHPKLIFSKSLPCRMMIDANIDKYMDFSVIHGI